MSSFGNKAIKRSGGFRGFAPRSDEAAGASDAPELDTGAVLEALSREDVTSQVALAEAINVTPATIRPKFVELWNKGFIEGDDGHLKLSESGERALTYSKMAKF